MPPPRITLTKIVQGPDPEPSIVLRLVPVGPVTVTKPGKEFEVL